MAKNCLKRCSRNQDVQARTLRSLHCLVDFFEDVWQHRYLFFAGDLEELEALIKVDTFEYLTHRFIEGILLAGAGRCRSLLHELL